MAQNNHQAEGMTQEELMTRLDFEFHNESGLMGVASEISDLIDSHAENDFQHYTMVEFMAWVSKLIDELNVEVRDES